ncbi:DUF1566 domain-containing protein [bacterium]|nr:DUF1566 domain-containing protein [bacterium]
MIRRLVVLFSFALAILLVSGCAQLNLIDFDAENILHDDDLVEGNDNDALNDGDLVESNDNDALNDGDFINGRDDIDSIIDIDSVAEEEDDDIFVDEVPDDDIIVTSSHIIPTHQTKCYNDTTEITCPAIKQDFYGQDAQYSEQIRIFTVQRSHEKIVVDSMTNLEWQQTISKTMRNWNNAIDYCSSLYYGEYNDWRLPTITELSTVMHYGKNEPAIDEISFPTIPSNGVSSSTTDTHNIDRAWYVQFFNGDVISNSKGFNYYVMCVRGDYDPTPSFVVSTITGDTIVTDLKSNLVWAQSFISLKTWKGALSYCEDLVSAGKSDWRLPDVNELKSIIDYKSTNIVIDEEAFPSTPSGYFWASTTGRYILNQAWGVSFYNGSVHSNNKSHKYFVRCVRGGGN